MPAAAVPLLAALAFAPTPRVLPRTMAFAMAPRVPPRACADVAAATTDWPLLRHLASRGVWRGRMLYVTGAELASGPVLSGTTEAAIDDDQCTLTSAVVLPSGQQRTVALRGTLAPNGGASRFESADGPIALIVAEKSGALLLQEVNRTSGAVVLASSMVRVRDDEIVQVGHELVEAEDGSGPRVKGVQLWTLTAFDDDEDGEAGAGFWSDDDEENFMVSGSML